MSGNGFETDDGISVTQAELRAVRVANRPITVYRYNDCDRDLDTTGVEEQQGMHAINIHRASRVRASTRMAKWSAGWQVMQDPDHFDFFMTLCERGALKFGNSFSYTLLESEDFPV